MWLELEDGEIIYATNELVPLLVSVFYNLLENFLPYLNNTTFAMYTRKCEVVVVSKSGKISGRWGWGQETLLILDSHCYLGIEFSSDGS